MQGLQYARCLEILTAGGTDDTHPTLDAKSPYKALLRCIGRRCRSNDEKEWNDIITAVERSLEPSTQPSNIALPSVAQVGEARDQPTRYGYRAHKGQGLDDLFEYSMALKEHCDQQGELMRFEEARLRAYPPFFKATVHMQGLSFEGTGSSKKMARHHACREACTAMHIEQ